MGWIEYYLEVLIRAPFKGVSLIDGGISWGPWNIHKTERYYCLALNYVKGRREFGYDYVWYDGPHKSFTIGPFNVYWNW